MSVFKKHEGYWSGIAFYGNYIPWGVHKERGGDASNYDTYSGRILDLKDGKASAIKYFKDLVEPELADGIAIATVPSHDPAKSVSGTKALAAALAENGNRIDASECLVRTQKIQKLAHGGDRNEEIHLKSVSVAKPDLIKGRHILLIDDVAKTGHSLSACRKLLLEAGAASVECATIGKT